MKIDSISAIEGTFWGMFQIGGFNYQRCGTKSHADFVHRMSRSERDQLELFARFIRNAGLLPALQKKTGALSHEATTARGMPHAPTTHALPKHMHGTNQKKTDTQPNIQHYETNQKQISYRRLPDAPIDASLRR